MKLVSRACTLMCLFSVPAWTHKNTWTLLFLCGGLGAVVCSFARHQSPTPSFFRPQTSRMFRLRDSSRARRRYSVHYVPTYSTHLVFSSDCDSHCCVATNYAMKPVVVTLNSVSWIFTAWSSQCVSLTFAGLNCFHFLCTGFAVMLWNLIPATEGSVTSFL